MQDFVGGGPGATGGDLPGGGRRRKTTTLAIVLLVLLLLSVGSIIYQNLTRQPGTRTAFVSANAQCLVCHSELVALMDDPSVHYPFAQKQCTSCHTTHGNLFEKRVGERTAIASNLRKACGPFIPISALQAVLERLFGRETKWKTTREAKGEMQAGSLMYRPFKHSVLTSPELKLCMTCHGNLGKLWSDKYRHPPFVQGRCTACHNPHASNYKPLLQTEPRTLCVTCHPISSELARAQVHPPFELQDCISCHGPHASNYKVLLRGPQKVVCLACHPTIAPLTGEPIQHDPFERGDCTDCHEPHAAPVKPLLPSTEPGFCYSCHPEIRTDFLRTSHHPVGVLIECTSCHQPHAWRYRALLLADGNEMCYTCHAEKRIPYVYTAHNEVELYASRGACVNCHVAHGSNYAPLLEKKELPLCWTCHPTYSGKTTHPLLEKTDFPRAGGKVTCASSCHDPHGTYVRNMLRKLPDGLCLNCHPAAELP